MDFLLNWAGEHYRISGKKICVAVSGGSDSVALLMLSYDWARQYGYEIVCVTVDHQLRPESAEEAEFVQTLCGTRGIGHHTLNWCRSSDVIAPGKLEMLAREARYGLMADFCRSNDVKFLLTGHNWNDQLETCEMRRQFGSQENGLAGMSRCRSIAHDLKLLRPLLYFPKAQLKDFLMARNTSWKQDPMNDDPSFLRVACRNQIGDYDDRKIKAYTEEILQRGRKRNNLETKAVSFLKCFCQFLDNKYVALDLASLCREAPEVQREILRRIIWSVGGKKYSTFISEERRLKILQQEINTLGRCRLKIKRDMLYVFREFRLPYDNANNKIVFESVNLYEIFL
jgi:tRNA(Ile)-lysidine synthase